MLMSHGNASSAPASGKTRKGSHPFWRVFWLAFLVASLGYAWYSFYVPANDVVWAEDFATAQQLAAEKDRPMLLFFTAEWCVPCRIMKREVFADAEVMKAINKNVVPVMLYSGKPGSDEVFEHYRVGSTPVTIFTGADGAVLDYAVGKIGKDRFLEMLDKLR